MYKLSSFAALVTTALIAIAAETSWSDETVPTASAPPAVQSPTPGIDPASGRYSPPFNRGGYTRWQQPILRPVLPPAYGQSRPYYLPHGQFQPPTATPVENPLSAELKLTQEQLTAESMELDKAHATLEQLQLKLQRSHEAEQALNEKVAAITDKHQAMQARIEELTTKLNSATTTLDQNHQQIASHQQQNNRLTAERNQLRDNLASRDKQLAGEQAERQAATQAIQQAQFANTLSSEQLSTAMVQTETLLNVLTKLNTRLESQMTTLQNDPQDLQQVQSEATEADTQMETHNVTLQHTEQALAVVTAQRDGLLADMATVITERDGLQKDLDACRRKLTRTQE